MHVVSERVVRMSLLQPVQIVVERIKATMFLVQVIHVVEHQMVLVA